MSGTFPAPDSKADLRPKSSRPITYRIRLIPGCFDRRTLRQALCDLFSLNDEGVTVHTLAWDVPYGRSTREKVATVTFQNKPAKLNDGNTWEFQIHSSTSGVKNLYDVCFDTTFEDFTPITQAENEEATNVDCIFIHGWGGHPIGSFSSPHGNWFWPRDDLCRDFPRLRIWLYGYHSTIKDAGCITSVYDYANTFRKALRSARKTAKSTTSTRPLLFIVHSLGGWVLQHAMIGMANSDDSNDKTNLQATCGALFFGVPNQGMHVDEMMMSVLQAKKLPARYTAALLDQQLGFALREQHENQFHRTCTQTNIKMYVFYEEDMTATYRQDETTGNWIQDGPPALSVNPASATYGHYQYENKISLKKNHNNMLKFTRGDLQYKRLLDPLNSILNNTAPNQENVSANLTEDEQGCLQSLAFPEMTSREINISKAVEGTCIWLEEHSQYVKWLAARNGALWIKGHPGVGKSTVMRHALRMSQNLPDGAMTLSFFFHGTGMDLQKNLLGLYRSLLHQLATRSSQVLFDLGRIFASRTRELGRIDEKWKWEEKELQDWILKYLLDLGGRHAIRIYIDALDEIGEDRTAGFLDFLEEIGRLCDESKQVAVCFASRHYPSILFESKYEVTVERENTSDIKAYIQKSLGIQKLKQAVSKPDTIVEAILARAGNSFQWSTIVVKRTLDMVKRGRGTTALLKMIQDTPQQLAALYGYLISQIDQEDKVQSLRMFQWLIFGHPHLTMNDLRIAIILEDQETTLEACIKSEHYCESNLAMENRLLILSAGLVECHTNYITHHYPINGNIFHFFEPRKTVNLIHQSVLDFLLDSGLESLGCEIYPSVKVFSQVLLARLCLFWIGAHVGICDDWRAWRTMSPNDVPKIDRFKEEFTYQYGMDPERFFEGYVGVESLTDSEPNEEEMYREWISYVSWLFYKKIHFPFLDSCFHDICETLRALDDALDLKYIQSRLLSLLHGDNSLLPAFHKVNDSYNFGPTATALHLSAGWCVRSLVVVSLATGLDLNSRDPYGGDTPLHMVATRGRTDIMEVLMKEPEIDLNISNDQGDTPLAAAWRRNQWNAVMMLLDRIDVQININVKSLVEDYYSPFLQLVMYNGQYTILEKLLKRSDLDVNVYDMFKRNSMMRIIYAQAHNPPLVERMMRLFLQRDDVQVNSRDCDGRTTLMFAAAWSTVAVVKLLLQAGADPNISDSLDTTTFDWVIDRAKRLITENNDPNGEPLLIAEALLAGQTNRNRRRSDGVSYLHSVAWAGWTAGVELLLMSGGDVNNQSRNGQTSLHTAVEFDHPKVLKTLLEHNADPNRQDCNGLTPLHMASHHNSYVMVRLLMNFKANIYAQSCYGSTALHLTSNSLIADLLISNGANLSMRGAKGYTPLHLAVINNNLSLVALLLKRGANINVQDRAGRSCLHYALVSGCNAITRLLLEYGVNVNLEDTQGWTALAFLASRFKDSLRCHVRRHLESFQSQIPTTDLDLDEESLSCRKDRQSLTLQRSQSMRNLWTCQKKDSNEYCDHSRALICPRGKNIRLHLLLDLLFNHGANINTIDSEGRTPLRIAREFKHTAVEQWLIKHGARGSYKRHKS